jgi:hypothetical protein
MTLAIIGSALAAVIVAVVVATKRKHALSGGATPGGSNTPKPAEKPA